MDFVLTSKKQQNLMLSVVLAMIMFSLSLMISDWTAELQFERSEVRSGEYYRLVTGNFVHLGGMHALFNGLALVVIAWFFGCSFIPKVYVFTIFFCALFISVSLLYLTDISWYRGFSGVLHGLYVVGALTAERNRLWQVILISALIIKFICEFYFDLNGLMPLFIEGDIVQAAHWFGALGGVIIAFAHAANRRYRWVAL